MQMGVRLSLPTSIVALASLGFLWLQPIDPAVGGLVPGPSQVPLLKDSHTLGGDGEERKDFDHAEETGTPSFNRPLSSLDALLDALNVMQDSYFEVVTATWPSSIDWTAAVLNTHLTATWSTIVYSLDSLSLNLITRCRQTLPWMDLLNRFFSQSTIFYFGENALSLRQQAYDDMLWVVLGWLEHVKLINQLDWIYTEAQQARNATTIAGPPGWHGKQFMASAAHRAHTFYDLASAGWDDALCNGGMLWSPHTAMPYKNSITNELFISASISMYLYFPGDTNQSPFLSASHSAAGRAGHEAASSKTPHQLRHLDNAIKAYEWFRQSNMTSPDYPGLYADGYHIHGWHRKHSGHVDPGTGKCDELNPMIYTYNQGVVLTGLRGLWLVGGSRRYLDDGHDLVARTIRATGWPNTTNFSWAGLGRSGVLEDYCDSAGTCSQNSHTFKGIFFHHLAEFCRPISPFEQEFLSSQPVFDRPGVFSNEFGHHRDGNHWVEHLARCDRYKDWVAHNARAAAVTKDERGHFGMWWGQPYVARSSSSAAPLSSLSPSPSPTGSNIALNDDVSPPSGPVPVLPPGGIDYQNHHLLLPTHLAQSAPPPPSIFPRLPVNEDSEWKGRRKHQDVNDRGRGRTVETQSGGVAVFRALWQWDSVGAVGADYLDL